MALPPSLEEKSGTPAKSSLKALVLRMLFAVGISFFIAQTNLDYLESYLYDLRVRTKIGNTTSGNIELIYITPQTVQLYKGFPSAKEQTALLKTLAAQQTKAIAYDFNFDETPGNVDDKNVWEETIISTPNTYVASRTTPMKGEEDQLFLQDPLEKVAIVPAPKTTDLVNFAKDGVTRRMILTYQDQTMLPVRLAALVTPQAADISSLRGLFDFYGTDQGYIDFHAAKSYPSTSFEAIRNGQVDLSRFKDKIVIIGTDLGLNEAEYITTPFSRDVMAMTRIEMQANIIDTLIKNSGPIKVSKYINWLFILIASVLTTQVVLTMKPTRGLLVLGATLAGFVLLSVLAFWTLGLWLPMAAPLLTILLCYYFFIPYRLIVENRRSWEYYQKNKLLSQVEELKTNFISMMSHDLKTPIARIQGMTDVILSDNIALSTQQREAVDTIKHSSDDLLKFINAILSYGRIESQGVQLNLQSKDINNLLQEVIRKHEFLAKVKRIQIVSELEPMFPVPVDPELMKQVFSNLVENAIKYSPEDTKIMVSSEETDTKVIVQVADQGPGIPQDELQNIFMKFFRSKNVKSSPIKGSGLGLYLAKYFTELHRGSIFVESSHGNGSTFTVELPIEQGGTHA
ncbi:CHASE2 and HATPase_c domain-containing protein [Bdellovibrio bacteriovorus]|uniref:CHASE2 and HATPase_c domain-containing protein n=1 Tax=Bdellovibrio bacteriovorus TaxID=959 RepID=UPI0021D02951|nr:CHASE2 and HATPase_c domain-containing protein [Bdellovibrio bacteriovorus]UXR64298.1 CHASE2 and HATPase_c domain-containing protein [Bdellovibrio bacteriovorus]